MSALLSGELGSLTGLLLFAGKESWHTFDSFSVFVRIYLYVFGLFLILYCGLFWKSLPLSPLL